ncbi:MAG: DUF554 domain-containing protein [Suipraeoptans sp.]
MIGLGTIVNGAAVVFGGCIGLFLKKGIKDNLREIITQAIGLSVMFIGIAGTMEMMLNINNGNLSTKGAMMVVVSMVIGSSIGELLKIEHRFKNLAEFLKQRFSRKKDSQFSEGFLVASLTICIGAMAVVGAIKDGISGDPTMLYTKAVLDFVILIVLGSTYGKGTLFSVIPLAVFQGSITLLSRFIAPILTGQMIDNISLIGSILIFCIGINLFFDKKIRVANMLPSLIISIIYGALPLT